jgi:hypothetical protein
MKTLRVALLSVPLALACAVTAQAADSRQDENAMFGGGDSAPATTSPQAKTKGKATPVATVEATPAPDANDDSQLTGADTGRDSFASGGTKEDPLQIGGTIYQQWIASPETGLSPGETPLSMPLQVDTFLDARPNDRVRGYVRGRLLYDSTLDAYSKPTAGKGSIGLANALASTATAAVPNNPQVVLDQAWLKFDMEHTVFVTVGKQHVKWGTGHIWNPTDFLTAQKYDPLQPYDARLGNNMVNFELPFSWHQTNVYAVGLMDNPQPASTLQQTGGAARIESVLGGAEVGLDFVTRPGSGPSYGADISSGLGPFDVYAEAAMLTGDHFDSYQFLAKPTAGSDLSSVYSDDGLAGPVVQAVGGMNYTFSWKDNRSATLGGEYFYNELGASNAGLYPVMVFLGKYQPYYAGKHYASIYLSAEGPDEAKNTSYNLSTIGNLSDGSYISRLDFSWLLLDYLTFGMFGDVHYGNAGGEFNFNINTPALTNGTQTIAAVNLPATPFDLGLSLRIDY